MWILCAFASAFFLGIYDVNNKLSLRGNAVIPVLFLNTLFCSLIFLPAFLLSRFAPEKIQGSLFYMADIDWHTHLNILLKSVIVLISWSSGYVAIKNLPITVVGPVKATQPAFVLLGALLLFGEQLNIWQIFGITVAITCFFLYSMVGKKEGIFFLSNKWILFLLISILSGAVSGLYDKYLMRQFDRMAVQFWYTFYQIFMMLPILFIFWYPKRKNSAPFQFRWTILCISFFLCLSDFLYFYALSLPDSMISVVSVVRRSGTIVSFLAGALFFHEKNIKTKALVLIGVLFGMFLLYLGSRT
ncbi:MAG: DMT family transporter [Bacteroidales bacterium]|mgnify:CR=1 FL=1|nr:DMT family transporter [Bacteroidales bacterium]MDD3907499.1 DMT family transporter [Bacteroidales bacterium]MDD4712493.1 DMT family transporter [Bacteroidales bacterium]